MYRFRRPWARDAIHVRTTIEFGLIGRLKILLGAPLQVITETETETEQQRVETTHLHVFSLPVPWLPRRDGAVLEGEEER